MQYVLACGAWLCNVCSEHKITQIFIHLHDFEKLQQQVMSIFSSQTPHSQKPANKLLFGVFGKKKNGKHEKLGYREKKKWEVKQAT